MMKVSLLKQFVASVTKWVHDEFVIAWSKLILIYLVTSGIFLSILSYVIYIVVRGNLVNVIGGLYNPLTQEIILNQALDALRERILLADFFVLIIVVVVAVFVTAQTLNPIRKNMQKQKRFIADASHELRTPLSVLKLNLEVLLREKHLSQERMRTAIGEVADEVDSMIDLTNSLLTFSRAGGKRKKEKIDVALLLAKITEKFQNLMEHKNITLTLQKKDDVVIRGVRAEIERVYTNIIKNAYQYTPEGGSITIELSLHGRQSCVVVADTGVGIHSDNLEKVFEPFYQEKKSRSGDGVGLGLSLVKKIVEDHQGTIEIESTEGEGTRITINI